MTNISGEKRVDSASRIIKASPQTIYQAFLDPEAIATWRPPEGMKCKIFAFEPREGGLFRMAFIYTENIHTVRGKTSEHVDVFQGRFIELIPDKQIVEVVEFDSNDPAFAGTMKITTTLVAVPEGTKVTVRCEDVPFGIKPEDHEAGILSSLNNLANFAE